MSLPLSQWLRAQTRPDHARVDAAYARFSLTTRPGYAAFLTAHARVLPAIEALLRPAELLGQWQGRAAALHADLAALSLAIPRASPLAIPPGESARWGALYVLEGSRLGSVVLARTVPRDLPCRFLDATHGSGEWRTVLARLDGAVATDRPHALAGARATFNAFIAATA